MFLSPVRKWRGALGAFVSCILVSMTALVAAESPNDPVEPVEALTAPEANDEAALVLARRYVAGGEDARAALLDALKRMGWSVRDAKNQIVQAAPKGSDTGLAMRDYELEELIWKPTGQASVRLISFAQALAVPLDGADPEVIAQGFVDTLRASAESKQPQQRFWARFILALSQVGPDGADLTKAAAPPVMQPSASEMKALEKEVRKNPMGAMQLMQKMQPKPVWPSDDPVLAPSPLPTKVAADGKTSAERDNERMTAINQELARLYPLLGSSDAVEQRKATERIQVLSQEMSGITTRMQANVLQSLTRTARRTEEGGENSEESEAEDNRFMGEWREQPLSLLQIGLLARVFAADLRTAAFRQAKVPGYTDAPSRLLPALPVAMIGSLQVGTAPAGGPPADLGGQFTGAIGDIWATGWGAYTGVVIERALPDSSFSDKMGAANAIIAWFKTIASVVRQNIVVEVENAPLIRTKNRSPGEKRTAVANISIDFPKSDVLKALRAAGNLTTLDLQMPDGGPVGGAKVTWRLTEGSYNNKYSTGKDGGWKYSPDLAVVQFAQAGGVAAYRSYTDDKGRATITIEGVPQKRVLPPTVRPYSRRAAISVEVTIKVGNLTQDLNDAVNTALGGPVYGAAGFLADMVLRTSFFFQAGRVFEVTDWREPSWQGEFEITIKASGSKKEKGEKGGPDQEFTWSMDRYIEGRFHTPEFEEESETKRGSDAEGLHQLEIDGDSRYFRLKDRSSSRTKRSLNRYEADGPLQIQPPGYNQFAKYSRAEPSGHGTLRLTGNKYVLDLNAFFGAQCLVRRSEQNGSRTHNQSGPQYLSLLDDVASSGVSAVGDYDPKAEVIEGTKTIDYLTGSLPYVPSFETQVTFHYRLWRNDPPPKNKGQE